MAIADIIVNPTNNQQIQELQISKNLQFSQTQASSVGSARDEKAVSFVDMLNSFNRIASMKNEAAPVKQEVESSEPVKSKTSEEKIAKSEKKSEIVAEKTSETSKLEKPENSLEKTKAPQNEKKPLIFKKESLKTSEKSEIAKPIENKKADKLSLKDELKNQVRKADKKIAKDNNEDNLQLENQFNRLANLFSQTSSEEIKESVEIAEVQKTPVSGKNKAKIEDGFENLHNFLGEEIILPEEIVEDNVDSFNSKDFNFAKNHESKGEKTGKITVEDLRTKDSENVDFTIDENKEFAASLKINEEDSSQLTMEIVSQNSENNILSLNNQAAAADNSSFQAMFNNQLQQNVPEIVKAGNIVLKDNNQGTIDLILHPDDIGSVKINLSLDGKTLSGHITVTTKEALEVFKDNAQTLREAFIKNGFDAANFDVSYSGGQQNMNQQNSNGYDGSEYLAKKMYGGASGGEALNMENQGDYEIKNNSDYSINIVA
ncbi:MAG: flagellar hook-length control protein FliK [Treponema sp.]|nr:flagellar hook-length control protein FliK [Treponema sp.]